MKYITNKYGSVKLPNEPGMLDWLKQQYPFSLYRLVDTERQIA